MRTTARKDGDGWVLNGEKTWITNGTLADVALVWARAEWYGFSAALELQYADKVYVNDLNADAAPRYTVANVRAGVEQHAGILRFREFVRINNLADRNYVGSVIVGDTNARYFEPAARRNYVGGVTISASF